MCMKGVKLVSSEANTSPGRISNVASESKHFGVGSTLPGNSAMYISQPSLANHIGMQKDNIGMFSKC